MAMTDDENIFARIWQQERLSCLDRSTLGSYLLDALPADLKGYVEFHLRVLNCPYCQSNLDDLREEAESAEGRTERQERLYESSVGRLPRTR